MGSEIRVDRGIFLAAVIALIAVAAAAYATFAFGNSPAVSAPLPQQTGEVQEIYLKALPTGTYDKASITVKKGVPVRLYFTAEAGAGCGSSLLMEDFNVRLVSRNGQTQMAEFTPTKAGTFYYHCSMWMFKGQLVVV